MDREGKKAKDGETVTTAVKSYLEALDRARTREPAPGGGDPFFENYKIADGWLAKLRSLVGKRQAARLIQAEEAKGMRYVFEPAAPANRSRRSRSSPATHTYMIRSRWREHAKSDSLQTNQQI